MNALPHTAKWWEAAEGDAVRCELCPHGCVISPGGYGFCGVRHNIAGTLYSLSYGRPVAFGVDPIEKKPLAEFMPGTSTFSFGTYGCNLNCLFCQNSSLSRGKYREVPETPEVEPGKIVEEALSSGCRSVAFTYNEPTVFAEYVIDVAVAAHRAGLATVLVSNGYINLEPARDVYPHIDAANIDMKGFAEDFYTSLTSAHLNPVLEAIKYFYSLGRHIEITNLVIPGKNDSDGMIGRWLDWVEDNLDNRVPLHFSAYHPAYKYNESPPTSPETLHHIRRLAFERGFTSVYLGNIR